MTIRKKLYLAYGIALAVTIVSGAISMFTFNTISARVRRLSGMEMKKLYLGGEINNVTSDMVAEERGILLCAIAKDQAGVDKFDKQFAESSERFKKAIDELTLLVETPEAQKKFESLKDGYEKLTPIHTQVILFVSMGNLEKAEALQRDQLMPLVQGVSDEADSFVDGQRKRLGKVSEESVSLLTSSQWLTSIAVVLSVIVAAFVVIAISRISNELQGIVFELGNGSDQVASAASQVSSSSQSLAQGASELASSLQQAAASADEVKSMASNNAIGAAQAADLIHGTSKKIDDGNKKLTEMVESMQEISESSQKISKIIKTIDEIAFQTNILALNAAVEAARAGEAGMGFAVVADEVRNLAQRCAQAANDTSTLIEDSINKSQNGSRKLDEVAGAIAEITADAASVKKLAEAANVSSGEQKKALNTISEAVTGMESVTQRTAAGAEEGAAAGEELSAQSQSLHQIVGRLSAMVGTQSNVSTKPHSVVENAEIHESSAWNISLKKVSAPSKSQVPDVSSFPLDDDFKEM